MFVQPILKGRIIQNPQYEKQDIEEYKDNPCIEALPRIFDDECVIKELSSYPIPTEKEKEYDENIKYHIIKRIKNYYQPLSNHLRIEHVLSCMIRRSYIARNPNSKEYLLRLRLILETIEEEEDSKLKLNAEVCERLSAKLSEIPQTCRSTAESSSIIGISGIGKSTAIEKLLLMYPQVIMHHEYKGNPLTRTQITWIKIDCPYDGSLKTLCKMFFKALDDILLTTNYFRRYGDNRNSTATMMIHMSHLACIYSVGVLVIDEMQHLINPKNKPDDVLNFLVTLVNMIGISIIQIGTPKVTGVITKGLREVRRAEEAGSIFWDRMKEDDEWDFFLGNLWDCQWLKNKTLLKPEIKRLMYEKTQGITSIAITLFILTQAQAIFTEEERITEKLIEDVAKNQLKLTNKVINAIRNSSIDEMANYEDITIEIENALQEKINSAEYKKRIEELSKQHKKSLINSSINFKEQVVREILAMGLFEKLDYAKIETIVDDILKHKNTLENTSQMKQDIIKAAIYKEEELIKEKTQVKVNREKDSYEKQDLRRIFSTSERKKIHIYELLKTHHYIKNPVDEFNILKVVNL